MLNASDNMLARFARKPFANFEGGEFSQVGNTVEEILGRLCVLRRNQRVVDVGSPIDGMEIPNSFHLMRDHEMYVLNIARPNDDLGAVEKEFKNFTVHKTDTIDIDDILNEHNFPVEFALLSLHTKEKNERDLWTTMNNYKPYVVVIPIEPRIAPHCDFGGDRPGFKTMNEFASAKGYTPVAHSGNLMVYVRNDLLTMAGVKKIALLSPDMFFDWHTHNTLIKDDQSSSTNKYLKTYTLG